MKSFKELLIIAIFLAPYIFILQTCAFYKNGNLLEINSPLKALIYYFPSSSVMRCLNHSGIPKLKKPITVKRKIKFPGKPTIEQDIRITPDFSSVSNGFHISGRTIYKGEVSPLIISMSTFFDLSSSKNLKVPFAYGFEELIGVQRKLEVKEVFGGQKLNYTIFLRKTEGMIGNKNYKLDLFGTDAVVDKEIRYLIDGKGALGNYSIFVSGKEVTKDFYEILERFGPIKVITTIEAGAARQN